MKVLKITGALVLILLTGCKLASYKSEVITVNKVTQGVFVLTSNGYHKKASEAIIEAEKNAFNVILFRGLPGTDLAVPLIANENDARSKSKEYFERFFEKGGYRNFIMSKGESSSSKKVKGGFQSSVTIQVNVTALRQDLEQNAVIRKFGY
jgi:hypothetical protein